jgi:reversibly glycosylated polypeptide
MASRSSVRLLALVVTTISDGAFLKQYARAVRDHSGPEQIRIYVVADLNTPAACGQVAEQLQAEGLDIRYLSVELQQRFLQPFPRLEQLLRYRSDERRNVGYLMALRDEADVIISVDDDNLPADGEPFFRDHASAGLLFTGPSAQSRTRWFNLGCLLQTKNRHGQETTIYPRGFPYAERGRDASVTSGTEDTGLVGINVGLWSGDPDVDAATRLVLAPDVARPREPRAWLLARGLRTPINTQNTALVREAIPAYWFVRMGTAIDGVRIGRFGDIFSGYFAELAAEAAGHRVRIGTPWLHQDRNEHRLLTDLRQELPGMDLIEDLVPVLERPLSPASTYVDPTLELADRLVQSAETHPRISAIPGAAEFLRETAAGMKLWSDVCVELVGRSALAARRS